MANHSLNPTDLRGILQYVPRFRDRIFIIALDGSVVNSDNFSNILTDLAVLRSLNISLVIVHGVSQQVRELSELNGIPASDFDGSGVTDNQTLKMAITASNELSHRILEGLSAHNLKAAVTNAVTASPLGILGGVDHLNTGRVERVEADFLNALLQKDVIPVAPPIGFTSEGRSLRVNSDSVATFLATQLGAAKILFVTSSEGLEIDGQLIRQISALDLDDILKTSPHRIPSSMLSKTRHATQACQGNVPRVHLINGNTDEALLAEVFSNEGVGSLIYANDYRQIRKALKKDIRGIQSLIQKSVQAEELVRRTRVSIERSLEDYYVYAIDNNLVGCVALHVYPESNQGELACLCVKTSHENQGLGGRLIQFVEQQAKSLGLKGLFALSTQAFSYFQLKAGFREGQVTDLPEDRRSKYEKSRRNSKILIKDLI